MCDCDKSSASFLMDNESGEGIAELKLKLAKRRRGNAWCGDKVTGVPSCSRAD